MLFLIYYLLIFLHIVDRDLHFQLNIPKILTILLTTLIKDLIMKKAVIAAALTLSAGLVLGGCVNDNSMPKSKSGWNQEGSSSKLGTTCQDKKCKNKSDQ